MFKAARRFHALPLAAKQAVAVNAFHRGYIGFAASTIITSSVEKGVIPNQSESLMVMHEVADDHPERLAGRPLQGPNQWLAELPGFRDAVTAHNDAAEAAGREGAAAPEPVHYGRYLMAGLDANYDYRRQEEKASGG